MIPHTSSTCCTCSIVSLATVTTQSMWSMLIEEGDFKSAKDFLLRFARRCPETDLPEIQELSDLTYAMECGK